MSDPKRVLILHIAGGGEPISIEVAADTADILADSLVDLVRAAEVSTIRAANDTVVVVNFAQVVTAHLDVLPPLVKAYGSRTTAKAGTLH